MLGVLVISSIAFGLAYVLQQLLLDEPGEAVPFVPLLVVLVGLISSVVYYRRKRAGGNWRLHDDGERMILEQVTPPRAFDLDDAQLAIGRYEHRSEDVQTSLPTVVITVGGIPPIVVTGSMVVRSLKPGERDIILADPEPEEGLATGAPHFRIADAAVFAALQARARER